MEKNPDDPWRIPTDYKNLKSIGSHPCSCVQHCHHLRYIGQGPRSVPCCTGLSKCFIQYSPGLCVTKAIWLHIGGATVNLQIASPSLAVQLHHMSWVVTQDLSLFSFSTAVKWACYIDDITITRDDLCLLQFCSTNLTGTSIRERMGSEFAENSRPRHCCQVWGSYLVRWDVYHPRNCDWQAVSLFNPWECERGANFCRDLKVLEDFYDPTPQTQCLHSLYCLVKKGYVWDWGWSEQHAALRY